VFSPEIEVAGTEQIPGMGKRRILVVDNNADLRTALEAALFDLGHQVVSTGDRDAALSRDDLDEFDLIISDLTEDACPTAYTLSEQKRRRLMVPRGSFETGPGPVPEVIKAFKMGAASDAGRYETGELEVIVERTLECKLNFDDGPNDLSQIHEKIEFELPSEIALMSGILNFLMARVARLGVINPEQSNLYVALDEAFVNAVKHGNKHDRSKLVRVAADLSAGEARFTIEDEGEGFDVTAIPDPLDPANLFKTSGRGVLLMYNIMDEVAFNDRGNRLTLVKRSQHAHTGELVLPGAKAED
jgi:serine/threonine-protein kinase RsbW